MKKPFMELFWGKSGKGLFQYKKQKWLLQPGWVCCYLPGDYHDIQALTTGWEYYWLTIEGPYLKTIIDAFNFKRQAYHAGSCPIELFMQLRNELKELSMGGAFRAGATAYRILSLAAAAENKPQDNLIKKFRDIIAENFANPEFDITHISNKLHVHRSTLNRQINRQLGVSPQEYLLSFRVQTALHLLCDSPQSIKEIATATGFSDPNYFGKVIKKRVGCPPVNLRQRDVLLDNE